MNCTEFDQHWQRRLDVGAGTDPGSLLAHVAQCPRCQSWQRDWETLERAIDENSNAACRFECSKTHQALADRVMAQLQASPVESLPLECSPQSLPHLCQSGSISHRGWNRPWLVRLTAVALVLMVLGRVWDRRRSTTDSVRFDPSGTATVTSVFASGPRIDSTKPVDEPVEESNANGLAGGRLVASLPRGEMGNGSENDLATAQPRMIRPLVGVVHNLTSLVLPGWPSVFNDSVGIPYYLDGETSPELTAEKLSSPFQAPLELVERTEVVWPEPVEELLAVATESFQTMWELANRW
jgi:hypothetical protein